MSPYFFPCVYIKTSSITFYIQVVWRKKGVDAPLTIGADTFVEEDQMTINVETITEQESHWDLLIKDVQLHHGGTYLCQVTASKLYTHYISLHVLGTLVYLSFYF